MVGPHPPPDRPASGGIEAVAEVLVQSLREDSRDQISVLSFSEQESIPRRLDHNGLDIHLLPYTSGGWRALSRRAERRALAERLRQLNPDIVHVQGQNFAVLGALDSGLPVVSTLHGILYREQHIADPTLARVARLRARLRNGVNARHERETLRRVRDLVIISPYVHEAVADRTPARLHPIPNPIDRSYFDATRAPVEGRILCVGVVGPRKNTLALVRAFATVARRHPSATLHVVGRMDSDSYRRQIDHTIAEHKLGDAVTVLGLVSDDRLRQEYREATVLCLPSKEESSPIALQQAMAMGLPIVASRAGGIPYLVEDGQTGLLVAPDDDAALAEAVVTVLDDAQLRERLIDTQRLRAERFRPEAVATETRTLYENLLSTGTVRAALA